MKALALRFCVIAAGVTAILGASVTGASAHAAYSGSNPPDESVVSTPPSEVTAEFTEPPAEGSSLSIVDECGRRVDNGDSANSGFEIRVTMSSTSKGTYTVSYRVTSGYDSHVTTGEFTFSSSGGDDCAGEEVVERDGDEGTDENPGGGGSRDDGSVAREREGSGAVGGETSQGRSDREARRNDRRPGGRGRSGGDGAIDRAARPPLEPARDRAPWDGIALQDFLVGMALAVLIGAAGGKVYAGIVGPRR